MIRYDRAPEEDLKRQFQEGGFLRILVDGLRPRKDFEFTPPEVQFPEKGVVAIHCGLTKLVTLSLIESGKFMNVENRFYADQPAAQKLMREWDLSREKRTDFEQALTAYLGQVTVGKSQWSGEGAIRARFGQRHGIKWKPELPWAVFDRDAVLGYETEPEKQKIADLFSPLKEKTMNMVRRAAIARGWAVIEEKNSSEPNFIGVGRNGETLALIEVKSGAANADIYYSSVRLLRDVLEWEAALKSPEGAKIIGDINQLIGVKKEIGLLPRNAPLLKTAPKIQPVLVVDRRDWTGQVEERRLEILKMINGATNGKLDNLQIETCL